MTGAYPSSSWVAVGALAGSVFISAVYWLCKKYVIKSRDPAEEHELYGAKVDPASLHASSRTGTID